MGRKMKYGEGAKAIRVPASVHAAWMSSEAFRELVLAEALRRAPISLSVEPVKKVIDIQKEYDI